VETKTCIALAVVGGALTVSATSAGIAPGAFASWTSSTPPGYVEDAAVAPGPGTYEASVTDATASLVWGASSSALSGYASGGTTVTARARGVALLAFDGDTSFAITWAMQQCVAEGNVIGWGLVDLAGSGDPTLGVQFVGTEATAFGGVAATASGSFTGTVAAGTYLLVMAAENAAAGGAFSYSATFSQVPAPGALVTLLVAGVVATARRRR
jgi:hypothetical protein